MGRWLKLGAAVVAVLALVLAGVALLLQRWVAGDGFRAQAQAAASQALGAPVTWGRVGVDLWPLPAVALDDVRVATRPPLTLARLEARPAWGALLTGQPRVATLVVRDAVLPQPAIDALLAARTRKPAPPPGTGTPPDGTAQDPLAMLPRRLLLDGVKWVDAQGRAMTLDASARLDGDSLPGEAQVAVRAGRLQGARVALHRDAARPTLWRLDGALGGGTVRGTLTQVLTALPAGRPAPAGGWQGRIVTAGVEVAELLAAQPGAAVPLSGRLDADTTLGVRPVKAGGALVDGVQTQTTFNVRGAVLHGVDLAQAVRTVGTHRGGQTPLDVLSGQVRTQGRAAQLDNLAASSGALAASGHVAVSAQRALSGRISVDLNAGAASRVVNMAVGVPLEVGGTLDAPQVSLSRGALLGAAVGTALMPGAGTGAGAKLGDRLGEGLKGLFGR